MEALKAAGAAAFSRREHAEAVREFSRALALAPEDVPLLCNRSAALLALGGGLDALRDAEEAERAALRAEPAVTPLKPLYRQAQALAALELWDALAAVCVRVLSAHPANPQVLALLRQATRAGANVCGEAGAEALDVAPAEEPPLASSEAAAAASELDREEEASSGFAHTAGAPASASVAASAAEPSGADYVADCRARANAAFACREFGQAVAWYTHGLSESPADFVLLANRAAARLALRQFALAAADAARAVALQPGYLKGALRAAICHLRIGEYAAAKSYCLLALDAQPSCAHAHALLDEARTAEERTAEVVEMAWSAAAAAKAAAEGADAEPDGGSADAAAAESSDAAKSRAAAAWQDVLEHSALLLSDSPLDGLLLAARARALAGLGDLDGSHLVLTRAREGGAFAREGVGCAALELEWMACLARDGPLAEALALARGVLQRGSAQAQAEPEAEAEAAAEEAAAEEAEAGCDLGSARGAAPSQAESPPSLSRAEAEPEPNSPWLACIRERSSALALRLLALQDASSRAQQLEVGATDEASRSQALAAWREALRACERGGAVEAGLRAREAALLAAAREWRRAASACELGLRSLARRATSGVGEGLAARKTLLLRRALCMSQLGEHAAAAVDYSEVLRLDPGLSAAHRGLAAAERALRLKATAGHYATLGVHVGAGDSELRRAYHTLALRWHPDRHAAGGEAARVEAEARFKEIAAAFEMLSDPQKRARYDVDMHFKDGG